MKLIRYWSDKNTTLGRLYLDGVFQCVTLEDEFRAKKVKGETRIPAGTYKVLWTFSNRFKREMLLIDHVPNFDGIRIHSGNSERDTDGCILVGEEVVDTMIYKSRTALEKLENKVKDFAKQGKLTIEIVDSDNPPRKETVHA